MAVAGSPHVVFVLNGHSARVGALSTGATLRDFVRAALR